ncbi:MAG: flagellar hook-associated protein FlgL [Betaproteobacteria bacterium]|nr:flagellar hook-associated protein FlgL [Betaproteobacteria bacterium]
MRISTANIFDMGSAAITRNQSELLTTQQKLASGRRILSPADDPIAASDALRARQASALNDQYSGNQRAAQATLVQVDSTLGEVTSLLQDVRVLVVSAGNATLQNSDRQSMAQELSGRLEQLVSLANSNNGTGSYLFGGYSDTAPPFAQSGFTVTYNGDQGVRALQVTDSRAMAVSDNGAEVFERIPSGNGTSKSAFGTIKDLIEALAAPVSSGTERGALSDALAGGMANLDSALDHVLSIRTGVGSRMRELEGLQDESSNRALELKQVLSQLEDIDYAQAASKLSQQQLVLQAAQQSFLRVSSLSLFNYL